MNQASQYCFSDESLPKLTPCSRCGTTPKAFFATTHDDTDANQPYVYIQCEHCLSKICSSELLGDHSNTSVLDKLRRVAALWRQRMRVPDLSKASYRRRHYK